MKNSIKKFVKLSGERFSRLCALLFISFILSSNVFAQDTVATASQDTAGSGPSLKNLKKSGAAITAETDKLKKEAKRKEILGYIYMGLGFSLVIAVAWFSTVKAKQYNERKDAERRKFLEHKMANQAKSGHAPRRPRR